MISEAGLSKRFWGECLAALVHTWNCCPTSALPSMTLYEAWYKKKPDVSHLRVWEWGCIAYVHIQKDKRSSLGSHMEKCVFIGYPEGYKGWKFYNPDTKKMVISERAEFDEWYGWNKPLDRNLQSINNLVEQPSSSVSEPIDILLPHLPSDSVTLPSNDQMQENDENDADVENVPDEPEIDQRPIALRRSKRNIVLPERFQQYRDPEPPVIDSDSENEYEDAQLCQEMEPQSYVEAIEKPNGEGEKWHEAALEEINAHLNNGTWTIVKLLPDQKAIGSRWVFRVKHHADGSIEHYKACIVAKGFSQRPVLGPK